MNKIILILVREKPREIREKPREITREIREITVLSYFLLHRKIGSNRLELYFNIYFSYIKNPIFNLHKN